MSHLLAYRLRFRTVALALGLVLLFQAHPAQALVIVPTFDTSITTSANSAVLQADINAIIGNYEALFTDNITVAILFRYSTTSINGSALSSGTLAQSNYWQYTLGYSTYTNALKSDGTTANDTSALANLATAAQFPNNPTNMVVSAANGRAVGLNTPGGLTVSGVNGTFDGVATLNSNQNFNFTRPNTGSGQFDALQSIQHEVNEVLGLGSILPSTTDFLSNRAVRPEDLFRYSAAGTLSLTSSSSATPYFSIDGGITSLATFNQTSGGDYGDWGTSSSPLVQLAFSNSGTQSDVTAGSPEAIALDAIGYNLAAVPEPSAYALFAVGLAVVSAYRLRRNARHGA